MIDYIFNGFLDEVFVPCIELFKSMPQPIQTAVVAIMSVIGVVFGFKIIRRAIQ